ncbi:MAG: sodium-dependent bicarbonate transport family permease [Candidatus Kapabacteria bacterium]|nr:sodium-dependent bicarbonate transport family permease [Candidatus Kapabacteria bacterium]
MDVGLLISNITNPTLLFFLLGILAVRVKSDLEIPPSTAKFISLYLLFSIGFKGGQELAHHPFTSEIVWSCLAGLIIAAAIPVYVFHALRRWISASDAGAIAACFGSVSAVTFVAASTYLEAQGLTFGGHMVAVMALMESPAIIAGVILVMMYDEESRASLRLGTVLHHALTNSSVLMIIGSLVIGIISDEKAAMGIKPFTTDMFKGFLAIFLLEMGLATGNRLKAFREQGWFYVAVGVVIPVINGCTVGWASQFVTHDPGNRFMFAVLAASASYIAVPAAMRLAVPKADPGLYIPMALGVTFPFNITLGMPLYQWVISVS